MGLFCFALSVAVADCFCRGCRSGAFLKSFSVCRDIFVGRFSLKYFVTVFNVQSEVRSDLGVSVSMFAMAEP